MAILSNTLFLFFSPIFSPFWRDWILVAQRENSWALPIFSPLAPLNQTPFPLIFFPIFPSLFSILPKIHPTKHTLSDNLWIRSPIFSISSQKFQIYFNGEPSKLLKISMTKKKVDNKHGKWENREQLVYFKEKH